MLNHRYKLLFLFLPSRMLMSGWTRSPARCLLSREMAVWQIYCWPPVKDFMESTYVGHSSFRVNQHTLFLDICRLTWYLSLVTGYQRLKYCFTCLSRRKVDHRNVAFWNQVRTFHRTKTMLSYHQKYWTDIGLRLIDQNLNWILLHDSEFDLSGFNKYLLNISSPISMPLFSSSILG